jgi:hypothetical protein
MNPPRTLESALWSAGMILFFAVLMLIGFPMRHGYPIWEAIP